MILNNVSFNKLSVETGIPQYVPLIKKNDYKRFLLNNKVELITNDNNNANAQKLRVGTGVAGTATTV